MELRREGALPTKMKPPLRKKVFREVFIGRKRHNKLHKAQLAAKKSEDTFFVRSFVRSMDRGNDVSK